MFEKLVQNLPVAASSPFALVSYICLLAAYVYVTVSTFRLKRVSKTLSLLPENQRAEILAKEYSTFPKSGLAPREWLTSRKHLFLFLAFLATLVAATIVVVISIQLGHSAALTIPNNPAPQPQYDKQPPNDTFKMEDSVSTEVRRAKPTIEFNFPTTGEKKQRVPVSVRPNLIQIEPKPTGVKEGDLPMDVPVTGGAVTVLRFDKDTDGGYMLFDTSQLPRGARIRGEIIGYEETRKAKQPEHSTKRERGGTGIGIVDGTINVAPCAVLQNGGNNNQANVNCGPPPLEFKWKIDDVPSTKAPNSEKQITLFVNTPYTPVSIAVLCDSEIESIESGFKGAALFVNVKSGTDDNNKNLGFVSFDSPTLTPDKPLLIWIWSKKPFNVLQVKRAILNQNN